MSARADASNISLILTCTVDPKGIIFMQRADPLVRLQDYEKAIKRWLRDKWIRNLVIVENSGYDLTRLRALAAEFGSGKNIEFLSFDGQNFPRELGKGYGETLALTHVLKSSVQLKSTTHFVKINGRYFVPRLNKVLANMDNDTQMYCSLYKGMKFSDSRVLVAKGSFYVVFASRAFK